MEHLFHGRPVWHHCRNRSDYGGLCGTMFSLERRGMVMCDIRDKFYVLTEAGTQAIKSHIAAAVLPEGI